MGFFDSVLDETPKVDMTSATHGMTKTHNQQDGSFLIIDDVINVTDMPNTAEQLFDPISTIDPTVDISFFSAPLTGTEQEIATDTPVISENSTSKDIFFTDTGASEIDFIIPETDIQMDNLVSFMDDAALPAQEANSQTSSQEPHESDINILADTKEVSPVILTTSVSDIDTKEDIVILNKHDIYEPIEEAIVKYDAILSMHTLILEAKGKEIADYNSSISELKVLAKQALDEQKKVGVEINRVNQMKAIFSEQLKQK